MRSHNLRLVCVQPPISIQIRPLRLFKQVIWGDTLATICTSDMSNRIKRIDRIDANILVALATLYPPLKGLSE